MGALFSNTSSTTTVNTLNNTLENTSGNTDNRISEIKYTNYMKKLMGLDILINNNVQLLGQYEKFLTDCAYMARLVYAPNEVIFKCFNYLDITPDRFNDVLTLVENTLYKFFPYHELYDTKLIEQNYKKEFKNVFGTDRKTDGGEPVGYFFKNNKQLNGFIYYNEKIRRLYLVFKGSSSFKDFIHDLKTTPSDYSKLPFLSSLKTNDSGIPNGHAGFASLIKDDVVNIISLLLSFTDKYNPDEIVITGHSLGGALSTVLAFCLGYAIKNREIELIGNPSIHLVTFGAPMIFSDYLRVKFNELIDSNIMTYDRITNNGDIVVGIPPVFSHGGYNILKTELYAFSKTKRTTKISELRKLFNSPYPQKGNSLPSYPEFLGLFMNKYSTINEQKYIENLRSVGGTTKERRQELIGELFPKLSKDNIQAIISTEAISKDDIKSADQLSKENPEQTGGDNVLFGKYSNLYKETTLKRFPNKMSYEFYIRLSANFSHAQYMGVGFLAGLRIPSLKTGRKKEPLSNYIYMRASDGSIYSEECKMDAKCLVLSNMWKDIKDKRIEI
jgi:hypothetical protein